MATFFEKRLTQLERAGISSEVVDYIRAHIQQVDSPGSKQISPYRMADEWNLPRREVLEAFLYGTRLDIFDLRWHVRCPSCKCAVKPTSHLSLVKSEAHCEYCQLDFQAGFDDTVELTFEVNKNIHQTDQGGWAQISEDLIRLDQGRRWLLDSEESHKIDPDEWLELVKYWDWIETKASLTVGAESTWKRRIKLKTGTFYVHSSDFYQFLVPLVIAGKPVKSAQHVKIVFDGEQLTKIAQKGYRPGTIVLHIANTSSQSIDLKFSRRKPYPWISAAQIASNQTFRDLFSSELISADEMFSIRNAVFMFTDIKGSTALYERLGDADAYLLVKKYVKMLTQIIRKHSGAVVKTIADVVMATFLVPADAIRALFEIHNACDELNAQEDSQQEIVLKTGAHQGPCIVVSANDRLDYFGQIVNIAAGIQKLSTGNDIVLTESLYKDSAVQEIVKNSGWQIHRFQATLRGIDVLYDVVHLEKP